MLVKDRILHERKKQGLNCAQLAQLAGLHKGTVNRYENGMIKRISNETLHKLADALSIPFSDLISDDPMYSDLVDPSDVKKTSKRRSSEEQEMIDWYRSLSPDAQAFFKQLWHIKPTI